MTPFPELVAASQEWLVERILSRVRDSGFACDAPSLAGARHLAVAGISSALLRTLERDESLTGMPAGNVKAHDPAVAFAVGKARSHRCRGVSLDMFMALLKLYRQSYLDLVAAGSYGAEDALRWSSLVERFFDRIEVSVCREWSSLADSDRLRELQDENRALTNEKNKFLTIFESLREPVILLGDDSRIIALNHAATELFSGPSVPGAGYYEALQVGDGVPWLAGVTGLSALFPDGEGVLEAELPTALGSMLFQVKMQRVLDVSGRFCGTVLLLNDVTGQRAAEAELHRHREHLEQLVRERTDDLGAVNRELASLAAELALAEERERRRIAAELHDEVGQTLAYLTMRLTSLQRLLSSPEALAILTEIRELIARSIQEIRSLTFQISPPLLYEVGLGAALESLAESFQEKYGFRVTVTDASAPLSLDEDIRVTLYQIVRELLANVAKHAAASRVAVTVETSGERLVVGVEDDGNGFDAAGSAVRRPRDGGFGLFNIRQRIARMGGEFVIDSTVGGGTRVAIDVPAGQGGGGG